MSSADKKAGLSKEVVSIGVELSPWAGQWCMVTHQVLPHGSVPTTFRVDDVSVRACIRP
jgi:hypothetical protein